MPIDIGIDIVVVGFEVTRGIDILDSKRTIGNGIGALNPWIGCGDNVIQLR